MQIFCYQTLDIPKFAYYNKAKISKYGNFERLEWQRDTRPWRRCETSARRSGLNRRNSHKWSAWGKTIFPAMKSANPSQSGIRWNDLPPHLGAQLTNWSDKKRAEKERSPFTVDFSKDKFHFSLLVWELLSLLGLRKSGTGTGLWAGTVPIVFQNLACGGRNWFRCLLRVHFSALLL